MAVGDPHTTGIDTLPELSKSKVKWGVVKMPLEFYEQVSGDLDVIAVGHLSFGVETDHVQGPVHGNWYS